MSTQKLEDLISRLEKVTSKLESGATGSTGSTKPQQTVVADDSEALVAFRQFIQDFVDPFLKSCTTIGGDTAEIGNMTKKAFAELEKLIKIASLSKKPNDSDLMSLYGPISKVVSEIGNFAKSKKGTPQFNHLSTVGEGIPMVQWPGSPTPKSFVDEMGNAATFYSNKILMEFKNAGDSGKVHVDFVKQFKSIVENLTAYVKEHHMTGLSWNPKGGDAKNVSSTPAPPKGGPPPPPPKDFDSKPAPKKEPVDAGALFSQINSIGSGETKLQLRHVKNEEKTKNRKPEEKVATVGEITTKKVAKKRITGKPRIELQDSKWFVENQDGNKDIVIEITGTKEAVYLNFCDNCNVVVKGKFNQVVMDNCVKTNLVFDSVVASAELVNCKSVKVQVTGKVPTILVDKVDGFHVYLSKDSLDTVIVSSKSSEMNVSVPIENDEFKEMPIPEQFQTRYDQKKGTIVTETNSHLG